MLTRLIPLVMLAVALLAPAPAVAHEGHAHKFMGTVSVVGDTQIEVKTTDGKDVVFLLDAKTTYQRGKTKVASRDIHAGERIVVSALEVPAGKTMTAQAVELPAAK